MSHAEFSLAVWALGEYDDSRFGLSMPAQAQQAAPANPQDAGAAESEDIVVTGSRIARRDYTSTSPIATIDSAQLQSSGELNIEEVLNDLPQIVPGSNAANNNPGGGQATVDLRGLGTARTLVLVNGKRFAPSTGLGVVDLNNLPLELLSRVEVVTGGASAVYGSDAVGGVVNFIIDNKFTGIEGRAYYGSTGRGDAERSSVSVRLGTDFAEGRGHITGFVSYYDREQVGQDDRAFSAVDFNGGSATGTSGRFDNLATNPFPSTPIGGVISANGAACPAGVTTRNYAFNADGSVRGFCNDTSLGPASDRYNFSPFNLLIVPQERYSVNVIGNYEIVPKLLDAYVEAFYTNSNVANQLAPTPLAPTATRVALVPTNNQFLSPSAQALLASRPNPNAPAFLRRRLQELGPRIAEFNSNVFTINSGIRGEILPNIRYDVYYSYQRSEFVNTIQGDASISRIQSSLNGCPAGSAPGCLPINFFGPESISQAGVDFIGLNGLTTQTFDRNNLVATLSGDLFELPAGPVGFSVGFEYREDKLNFLPDDSYASGDLVGFNAQQPVQGGFDVYEGFGEISIPILKDLPLFKSLSAEGGFRVSGYSSVGVTTTYKGGGDWSPFDGLRFRGVYQRAVRAPSVFELFQAGDTGFPLYFDPCATSTPFGGNTPDAATIAACNAQFASFGQVYPNATGGGFIQTNAQFEAISFGNPNLEEESSNTFTVGAVVSPSFFSGFTLSADYYNINVANAINTRFVGGSPFGFGGADGALNLCIAQGGVRLVNDPSDPCFGVVRTATGDASVIFSDQANTSNLSTKGLDVSVDYRHDLGSFGDVQFKITATRLLNFTVDGLDLTGSNSGTGTAFPKWRANLRTIYSFGPFAITGNTQFIDGVLDGAGGSGGPPVPKQLYQDISATYDLNEHYQFQFGINNLSNNQPPLFNSNTQSNTDPAQYDVIGRFFFVAARARF